MPPGKTQYDRLSIIYKDCVTTKTSLLQETISIVSLAVSETLSNTSLTSMTDSLALSNISLTKIQQMDALATSKVAPRLPLFLKKKTC
jgi:hypothetical protein